MLATDCDTVYPKLFNSTNRQIGWIKQIQRGEVYSIALEIYDCELVEYEILNTHLEEIIDFTQPPLDNLYYRCK